MSGRRVCRRGISRAKAPNGLCPRSLCPEPSAGEGGGQQAGQLFAGGHGFYSESKGRRGRAFRRGLKRSDDQHCARRGMSAPHFVWEQVVIFKVAGNASV